MLGASVDLEFSKHVSSEVVLFRKHSLDGKENEVGWFAFEAFTVRFDLLAVVSVVPGVVSVFEFAAAHLHFFSVDDDDIFPGIDVWGVLRAVFAHQNHCDFACQATEGTVGCVDHVPFLIDFTCFSYRCLLLSKHNNSSTFLDVLSLDGENRPDWLQKYQCFGISATFGISVTWGTNT